MIRQHTSGTIIFTRSSWSISVCMARHGRWSVRWCTTTASKTGTNFNVEHMVKSICSDLKRSVTRFPKTLVKIKHTLLTRKYIKSYNATKMTKDSSGLNTLKTKNKFNTLQKGLTSNRLQSKLSKSFWVVFQNTLKKRTATSRSQIKVAKVHSKTDYNRLAQPLLKSLSCTIS